MAWVALESPEKYALAESLGAVPKYPSHVFKLPKAKPKPRPQPLREEPGTIVAADTNNNRKVDNDPPCTCTCKARRLIDALTDLDRLLVRGEAAKQK